MRPTIIYPILLLTTTTTAAVKKPPKDSILLSNVKSLTLRANSKTSHRRVSAIPQLTCKGPGCKHYSVDVMRCVNQGSGYNTEDIEWSCAASLPEEFKLGSTDVICEGYANADDERVLKGSCGVEYRLLLTDKGEEKYGGGWFSGGGGKQAGSGEENDLGAYLFGLLFLAVLGWILYSMWAAWQGAPGARRRPRQGGFWGGGWGGGGGGGPGGGDPYDPPPPYPGKRYNYGNTGAEGWRPGFWSGALGGAAAGYMAGNRGGRQQEIPQRNAGWFGGGGNSRSGWGAPTRGNSGSSSSSSGARHESTGFGSTSRR